MPFELNSVKRCIGVNVVQSAACWSGTTILIPIMAMFIGIIYYMRPFLEDTKTIFNQLDRIESEIMNFLQITT